MIILRNTGYIGNHGEIEQAGKTKMLKNFGTGINSAEAAQVINVETEKECINMKRNLERHSLNVSGSFISNDLWCRNTAENKMLYSWEE